MIIKKSVCYYILAKAWPSVKFVKVKMACSFILFKTLSAYACNSNC